MATSSETKCKSAAATAATLAKSLAPEEVCVGDFVAPLYITTQWPSFYWGCNLWNVPPDELMRIRSIPSQEDTPYKVQSVCVPFVLVKTATGESKTLDLRTCQLARLDAAFARQAWKAGKKLAKKATDTVTS
jgi:hypothetical protein